MPLHYKKMSDELFNSIRKEVLTHWPTGKGVDFDEAVAYQLAIPANKK